jgi:hypothetical protein
MCLTKNLENVEYLRYFVQDGSKWCNMHTWIVIQYIRDKSVIQQEDFFSPANLSGAEPWTFRKIQQKYLERCWRRLEISSTDCVKNELLCGVKEDRNIQQTIQRRMAKQDLLLNAWELPPKTLYWRKDRGEGKNEAEGCTRSPFLYCRDLLHRYVVLFRDTGEVHRIAFSFFFPVILFNQ